MNNGSGGRGCAYEQQSYPNECGIVAAGSGQVGVGVQSDGSLGSISPPFAGMKPTAVT